MRLFRLLPQPLAAARTAACGAPTTPACTSSCATARAAARSAVDTATATRAAAVPTAKLLASVWR